MAISKEFALAAITVILASTGCVKKVAPYPFYDNQGCYKPVAYNEVC